MSERKLNEVTRLIKATESGDKQAASQLLPLVYSELRRLASQRLADEKSGHSLEATGLVHDERSVVDYDPDVNQRGAAMRSRKLAGSVLMTGLPSMFSQPRKPQMSLVRGPSPP